MIDLAMYRLMRQLRSASAGPTMGGRWKPDFASLDFGVVLTWRTVSPSAKLMVDPRTGARAVIWDTRSDAGRFRWSVLALDQMDPMSDGRTDDSAQAQALAEAALHVFAENRLRESGDEVPSGHIGN